MNIEFKFQVRYLFFLVLALGDDFSVALCSRSTSSAPWHPMPLFPTCSL